MRTASIRLALLVLMASCGLPLIAQRPDADLVKAGPQGLFVFTGPLLAREGGPVTSILIERRVGDEAFKRMAELKPVTSAKDVQKGMEKAAATLPYPMDLQVLHADSIWASVQRHGTREQLGAAGSYMVVLMATGAVWLDTDVKAGLLYQYRVTTQGNGNQFLSTALNPASLPIVDRLMPANSSYYEHQRELNTWWTVTGDQRPAIVQLFRSVDEEPFELVRPRVRIDRRGQDTVLYQFADTTAPRHRVFRYAVKGWDRMGNAMPVGDTLYAASLDPTQMPMPYDLVATGDSTGRRIQVRWSLANAPVVKQITLQRSTNSVSGFTTIAELSGDLTAFVDEDITPATSYFYRFVLEYKATHVPMRGVSFAAVAYDAAAPSPVLDLFAEATTQGVAISWTHPDPNVLGFEVHRGEGNGPLLLAASRMDLKPSTVFAWQDSSRTLHSGGMYRYAVRAISTSHVTGAFGDTVTVMPVHNSNAPLPPRDLTAQVDGGIAIIRWEDQSSDPLLQEYLVIRTSDRGKADTLHRATNFLMDTLDAGGRTQSYRVISKNALGFTSSPTPEVRAQARVELPSAPSGVEARTVGAAVQLVWEASTDAKVISYQVYRYTRGSEPVKLGSVAATKPARFEDASPAQGALNFYFVRSVAASGAESGPSGEAALQL
jgi:hypothetical protein